ncbi:MAG: hypothetical protein H6834_18130 [Planctomycetes bacterium]|nr:hypothetical protein [Planctomycetota bacterium]
MPRPPIAHLVPARLVVSIVATTWLAAGATSQTTKSIAWIPGDDIVSLDNTAGPQSAIERFDLVVVTPDGGGSTAIAALPTATWSAFFGDPDNDGLVAEYYKDANRRVFNHSGCLLKREDKGSKDRRDVYISVHRLTSSVPVVQVHTNAGRNVVNVEPGDFFRIRRGGDAEFFITQKLLMKAAGPQTSTAANMGASALTQSASGDLYYSPAPPNGHEVSDGTSRVKAEEGSIVWIPASAITYDASGNVQDVTSASARLVIEMGTNSPSPNPTCVGILSNSGAMDSSGVPLATTVSNWVTNLSGLCIDPNGGTFTSRLTGTTTHPNLWLVFDNPTHRGTILSTKPRPTQTNLGSIGTLNGVLLGSTSGAASGAWLGVVGDARGPAPFGLEVVDWGVAPKAPHGLEVADASNSGGVDLTADKDFTLVLQALRPRLPSILVLGGGPARGGYLPSVDLPTLNGFASLWTLNAGPITGYQGLTDNNGRTTLVVPLPSNPSFLKGISLIWQGAFLNLAPTPWGLTNPVVTDFR